MGEIFATLHTNVGPIRLELFPNHAPKTVANFVGLAEGTQEYVDPRTQAAGRGPYYDGVIFHRVIPNFMIQGGGFDADMKQKPTKAPIKNEASNGLKNRRATVAMARTNDPDSATSQFFINVKDNTMLDYGMRNAGYAVFGEVVEGMDVVDRIVAVPTTARPPHADVPRMPVVIKSAREVGGPKPAAEAPAHPKHPKASPHDMPSPHKPAKSPSPHP